MTTQVQPQMCSICMDDIIECKNCTTTECGHTFHSSCIFSNLCHRVECPMCRTALVTMPEDEDDEDDEGSESGSDEDSEADTDAELSNESTEPRMNIANLTKRLVTMGYTMEDMVMAHLGGSFCQMIKGLERHNDEFFEKYEQTLDDIVDGKIAADFRDDRTFAQVVAGTRQQPEAH